MCQQRSREAPAGPGRRAGFKDLKPCALSDMDPTPHPGRHCTQKAERRTQGGAVVKKRTACAVLVCALSVPLLAGCATQADRAGGANQSPPAIARPDPMSTAAHPLERLLSDPLFATLPPGATKTGEERIPPHNEPVIFGSGGTFGAAYVIDFTTSAPPDSVNEYFAQRAAADGWRPVYRSSAWSKVYPDGVTSWFSVDRMSPEKSAPPYWYSLIGSI